MEENMEMRILKIMSKIKVALRVRPLSSRERDEKYPLVVQVENNSAFITDIRVPEKPAADSRQRFRQFDFDHAFWLTDCCEWGASQEEVYNEMAPALEKSILQGYNACLLAYGQSGTGKTHTMLGTKTDPGLIPRLCHSLWEKLRQGRENSSFRMEVSFMEIYREKVRDLLTPDKPLKLREHPQNGPHVQDFSHESYCSEMGIVEALTETQCT
ncbi:unnamed protein product [Allacma fusca]|uniref:Kinesin motor domain-containing protein n=1 Tax=Allacma fusca TaxID=39272 RepID=A0A8J2J2U6_9HEXA|nr:unnamed protein product [Allacma fusca]